MSQLIAVVLAAGHGTRMKSPLTKVLHQACGRPLIYYPMQAALDAGADKIVVVVNPSNQESVEEALGEHFSSELFSTSVQEVPKGTGDAARAFLASGTYSDDDEILLLNGDVPLLSSRELGGLTKALRAEGTHLSFLTFKAEDPTGYGRILRDASGQPQEIREHRDLKSDEERAIREVNAGVYAAHFGPLKKALGLLKSNNAQGEYYLTDIVPSIAEMGRVLTVNAGEDVLAGVNDRGQLSLIESALFARRRQQLGESGVTIVGTPLIDDTVVIEPEAVIEDGVRLRGSTRIGAGTRVDVGTVVMDSVVGENVNVKPYCVLSQSRVGDGVQLGPFAHLRPDSVIEAEAHIGNFVETKKTLVKRGAKANHLAYLGDAEVGERSNLGAGTIVCNYNGYQKQRTVIGADVFVGSDSQLVAPVTIGQGAYVATASTVTEDVPADALAIGRSRQVNKEGYAPKLRERFSEAARLAKQKK